MSEVNAPPTPDEIKLIRADIETYLTNDRILDDHAGGALTQFKIDLEDKRDILFSQVFDLTNDKYFEDSNGNTRNLNKIRQEMLCNLTVSKIFRDYAIATAEETESRWWDLANEYESRYEDRLNSTQLDVDWDGDGVISPPEERTSSQTFFRK